MMRGGDAMPLGSIVRMLGNMMPQNSHNYTMQLQKRKFMNSVNRYTIAGLAIAAVLSSTASLAASKAQIDKGVSIALKQFQELNPGNAKLENEAAGILVFPRITKAGAGVAGEYGEGVLQVNGQTAGYYSVSSASVGITLGLAKHKEVILFMTPEALNKFTNSKGWSVGADTGIAVISKGAGGAYDTETLKKPILGFVYGEKGLIADVSLEGSKINQIVK
jgi:lipid-binding SYLF domain-containing protein